MDSLKINIEKYLEDIINVYVKIFGEQYRSIIEERIKGTEFIEYKTEQSVRSYIFFLENCKAQELSIKFLSKIGIDVSSLEGKPYTEELPDDIRKLIREYIGGISGFTYLPEQNTLGIRAFDKNVQEANKGREDEIERNQIEFLSFLFEDQELYSKSDVEEFFKTEKGQETYKKIQEYIEIYNRIFGEYQEFENTLEPYREYVKKRKNKEISETEEFKEILEKIGDTEENRKILEYILTERKLMTIAGKNLKRPTIFFSRFVSELEKGGMDDYTLLHEYCHAIEIHKENESTEESFISGFDLINQDQLNPYRKDKRKYERLNETITDIFSVEATRILHNRGIYISEPRELTNEDILNCNTSIILKKLLMPFVEKYKENIVSARITGNMQSLFNRIERDNFETLNDCINKIDYLITEGLTEDLKFGKNNSELVKEYNKQKSRIEEIYRNMEIEIEEIR